MKNTPFVKDLSKENEGFPKTGWYPNPFPNRRARRSNPTPQKSGIVIIRFGSRTFGYRILTQRVDGKNIYHYVPKTRI